MKRYYVGMFEGRPQVIERVSRRLGVDDCNDWIDIEQRGDDTLAGGVVVYECHDMQLIIHGEPVTVPAKTVARWRCDKVESIQKEMQYFLCHPALFGIEYSNTDGLGGMWARLNKRIEAVLVPSGALSLGDIQHIYFLHSGESVPILGS